MVKKYTHRADEGDEEYESTQYLPDPEIDLTEFDTEKQSSRSPFAVNRWYAQYNPSSNLSIRKQLDDPLFCELQKIPAKVQRRIRNDLNSSRVADQQITYEHIKPGSPSFNKKYAKLVLRSYHLQNYLKTLHEKDDDDNIDAEVLVQVSAYNKKELCRHFNAIPLKVREEIMNSLNLNPAVPAHHRLLYKQQIVAVFKSQYME